MSASFDGTLKVWDLTNGIELYTLPINMRSNSAVALLSDGQYGLSISGDGMLEMWDIENGAVVAGFGGDSMISSFAVSPDGVTIAIGEIAGRMHFLKLEGIEPYIQRRPGQDRMCGDLIFHVWIAFINSCPS